MRTLPILLCCALTASAQTWVRSPAFRGAAALQGTRTTSAATDYSLPPTNTFVKDSANPAVFTGAANSHNVLIENAFYDTNLSKWFAVGQITSGSPGVGLFTATNPCYAGAWSYVSNLTADAINPAPHMLRAGTNYYLYVGRETNIVVYSNASVYGPFTGPRECIRTNQGTFDAGRVTEPYAMANAARNGYILWYMADQNGPAYLEQVCYATAPNPDGPWTKYSGNPLITFGATNTYDSRCVADPSAVYSGGKYYVQYAAQVFTNVAGWTQIGMGWTSDLTNFTRGGVLMATNEALHTWDSTNVLRGAVTLASAPGFNTNRVWVQLYSGTSRTLGNCDVGVATVPADSMAPDLANVQFTQTNSSGGLLSFITSINSKSGAAIGTSSGTYSATNAEITASNFSHTIAFTGLSASTPYYFLPLSTNIVSTSVGGVETNFTTYGGYPTYVQSTNFDNGASSVTVTKQKFNLTTTAGNTIFVSVFQNDGSATSVVTNSAGLNVTLATNCVYASSAKKLFLYYITNITSSASFWVTNTSGSSLAYTSMSMIEASGIKTYQPMDTASVTQSAWGQGAITFPWGPATLQAGDYVVEIVAQSGATWGSSSPYTLRQTSPNTLDATIAAGGSTQFKALITSDQGNPVGALAVGFLHK